MKKLRGVLMGMYVRAMLDIWKLETKIEGRYLDKVYSSESNYKFKIDFRKPPCLIVGELKGEIKNLKSELELVESETKEHKELLNFILLLSFKELSIRERAVDELNEEV